MFVGYVMQQQQRGILHIQWNYDCTATAHIRSLLTQIAYHIKDVPLATSFDVHQVQ